MSDSINDILKAAEDNISSILKHKGNRYLRNFLEAAFIPDKKMALPAGVPSFKKNAQSEYELKGQFWQFARKIETFQREDIPKLRKETLFIQTLESLSEVECDIVLAAKEQKLHKMFKGVTFVALTKIEYF